MMPLYKTLCVSLLLVMMSNSSGFTQSVKKPLLGMPIKIQEFLALDFCRLYQCKLVETFDYRKSSKLINWSYWIETTFDDSYYSRINDAIGKGTSKIQLTLTLDKKNRLEGILVQFDSRRNTQFGTWIYDIESQYLTGIVYLLLNKKYYFAIPRISTNPNNDQVPFPKDDMRLKCMRDLPIGDKNYRVLTQGKIFFNNEKTAFPYFAYCLTKASQENPNAYPEIATPIFLINDTVYLP
jgi:hypothetical protein